MKKILLVFMALMIFIPFNVKALNQVNLYLFYGKGCPHCEAEMEFLNTLTQKYDNLKIYKYEVLYNGSNVKLLEKTTKVLHTTVNGVPFTVVGNEEYHGFREGVTDKQIEEQVKYYSNHSLQDKVGVALGVVKSTNEYTEKKSSNNKIDLPFLGKTDVKSVSLPLVTILLGILDGFNPCAMWILLFLISMLLGMEDRRRMWILGITFLVTSATVYLFFMLSFIQFASLINSIYLVRLAIALVAIIGGLINLRSYLNKPVDDGCEVVDTKKRKKIIKRVNKFTTQRNLLLALFGVMALAASVNLVELACSAGFPVIFMQILALNNVGVVGSIGYVLIYILFFLLDDLIVFTIAMKTLELKGISNKYTRYSHLIGGILMIIIGIMLVFKPEWLMFNF